MTKLSSILVEPQDEDSRKMIANLEVKHVPPIFSFSPKLFQQEYEKNHPEVIHIDPVSNQRAILDRGKMAAIFEHCEKEMDAFINSTKISLPRLRCPRYLILSEVQEDYSPILQQHGIEFPVST